jgi:hypothetical protein
MAIETMRVFLYVSFCSIRKGMKGRKGGGRKNKKKKVKRRMGTK